MKNLMCLKVVSSLTAVIITTLAIMLVAYSCSGFSVSWSMYIGGACLLLTPFYIYIWNRPDMCQQDLSEWFRSVGFAWSLLLVLLMGDVLIGKLGNPNATFWRAAASTAAFYATVFLSPLVPAAMSGFIRALLREYFGDGPTISR